MYLFNLPPEQQNDNFDFTGRTFRIFHILHCKAQQGKTRKKTPTFC